LSTALTWFLMLGALTASADLPSIGREQVLANHMATQARLHRCAVFANERCLITRADAKQILSTRQCSIRWDGQRANLLVNEVSYPMGVVVEEASKGSVNEFNYVCDDQVLQIFWPREKFDTRPELPSSVIGKLSQQADDEYFVQNVMGHGAIAFGMTTFLTPISISKLISLSKTDPVPFMESGYCVDGTAPDGTRYKIWFDPNASFIVRRMTFEQSGNTLNDNRFQYNRRVLKSVFGFPEKAVVNSVLLDLRVTGVEPRDGTYLLTAVETTKTILAEDGTKAVEQSTHTLTDWNLNLDVTDPELFRPQLPLRDGSRVLIRDTPSLEYIYKDGKIQLAINKKMVESLEQIEIPSRPTPSRMTWVWGVVSVILAIAWWRLRANSD